MSPWVRFLHRRISIHAPARGATSIRCIRLVYWQDFNPRSREGSDEIVCAGLVSRGWISIHAPARGATAERIPEPVCTGNFNPRSREGSDGATGSPCLQVMTFQSTLPRGERPLWYIITLARRYFNPRSREGSDQQSSYL